MPTPRSRAAAIEAKCRGCLVDPYSAGTAREQIAACTSETCPLFAFRPLPKQVRSGRETIAQLRRRLDATNGRR